MASDYKNLGQSNPSAATDTLLYTVPASHQTIISSIVICNRSSTATSFRVAVLPGGGAVANEDYLYYDHPILGNDTFAITLGITMNATDTLRIYATLATLSFNAYGDEYAV